MSQRLRELVLNCGFSALVRDQRMKLLYARMKWGGRYEEVFRCRLFVGISIEPCWLRGQRQVPGWQGKSTSASRRNEGLVSAERSHAGRFACGRSCRLYAIPERFSGKLVGAQSNSGSFYEQLPFRLES